MAGPGTGSSRVRTLLLAGLVLAVLGGLVPFLRKRTSELPVYVKGAARMAEGLEIYRPDEPKPFTYPPFFALPFLPLVPLSAPLARSLWYFFNVGLLLWIFRRLHRRLAAWKGGIDPPGIRSISILVFWVSVILVAGRHLSAVFENQSHDLIILGLLVLSLEGPSRAGARGGALDGGALGTAAACKATPLIFAPVLFWQRRWKALAGFTGALLLATLLPDLLFPRQDGRFWAQAWFSTFLSGLEPGSAADRGGAWSAWNYLNQSLSGSLHRLFTKVGATNDPHVFDVSLADLPRAWLKVLNLGAQGAVLGLLFLGTRRRDLPAESRGDRWFRRLGETGLGACAMVLLSPMSSKSHFCVLLLPAAYCIADFFWRSRDRIVLSLLLAAFASGSLTAKGLLGAKVGNLVLAHGSVTFSALALFLATAHVLHHREGRAAA